MGKRSDLAVRRFQEGRNCAQAVLSSFCPGLRLGGGAALRVACGFGGGMGRRGEVCGAVSGAIMALGLRYGGGKRGGRAAVERTYRKVRELARGFERERGALRCRPLLGGCDLSTVRGHGRFRKRGLREKVCVPCVRTAARLLEELLGR